VKSPPAGGFLNDYAESTWLSACTDRVAEEGGIVVKKIDYYAVQNPWKMPKWLGATLGGIFGVIALGSVAAIVQITKSDAPPIAAVAAAPVGDSTPAATPAAAAKKSAPVVAAANVDEDAPVVQPKASKRASSKHHASKSKKASMRLASAKKMPASSSAGRATMLAKHDTKSKRNDKDALDKLLGL
jgi:hypothetical protein